MLSKHFIRSTDKDDLYSFGPKVSLKYFNLNETITLTITEFVTPTIFFAYDSSFDVALDRQINLLYDSLSEPMRFSDVPQIGTTCVGRYSLDNRWYRARVVDRNHIKMTVDLLYIDYGNIERSVHYKNIRKLEGTLSTQFSSFMDCSKLNSQAALFGFMGAVAGDTNVPWKDTIKDLEMKGYFDFQVISVPDKKSNMKNQNNTNIPLYLIKNNVLNKDPSSNYQDYLVKSLNWSKCDMKESKSFLINSFKNRIQYFKNIQILLPNLLQDFNDIFNPKQESIHSLEDDDGVACVTPVYSDIENSDNDDNTSTVSSIKRHNKKCEDDIIIIDSDDDNNKVNQDLSNSQNNKDEDQNDEEIITCSINKWNLSSILVKSPTHSLQWHIPVPEEHTFKAIITSFNEKLEFHINVCSEEITETFKNMETLLLKHFILCNDSMLKHYVTSNLQFSHGTVCLCSLKSTYYRCIILNITSSGDVTCRLIDFGDEIILPKSDFIPISDQFCQVPPLAIRCTLAGFHQMNIPNMDTLRNKFQDTVEQVNYEVLVSICLLDKLSSFNRMTDKVIIDQPVPLEVFIVESPGERETIINSVNAMLINNLRIDDEVNQRTVDTKQIEKRNLNGLDIDNDDGKSGMQDIFINENLHQQTNMRFQDNKRRVCEYYRAKGRCFKGSKCQDRHVMDSDESDDDSQDWKMMEQMHYLDDNFERQLSIGSFIGVRISAIYTTGIFYAYLTHDINGFLDDGQTYFDEDDIEEGGDEGLEFKSINDMEMHLREFLKYQQVNIDKRFDLPVNTMVAVSEDDMVHRGSIRRMVSDTRYQVFLVDYGVPVEASVSNLSLLPKKYMSKFRQQCFLCKLSEVTVTAEQSYKFADWFFDKVNRKVLHCRVVDTDQDMTNYVELYNFNDTADSDINSAAKKILC